MTAARLAYSPAEVAELLGISEDTVRRAVDRGELLGLTWADVDRDAGTITVRHALVRHRGTYRLDEPKTRRSVRTIAPCVWSGSCGRSGA